MNLKKITIFGGSGNIGCSLIRKLTQNNFKVTVVTRNLHRKGYVLKTQGNPGYIEIVESNIFDEIKIRKLIKNTDIFTWAVFKNNAVRILRISKFTGKLIYCEFSSGFVSPKRNASIKSATGSG